MKKRTFYTEAAYVCGILILALGTAFMERADFGVSMVVAPAYLIHLKVSQVLPFFSFGMAEYSLQAVILILLGVVLRRFRLSYLFSFVTAVLYGFALDGFILIIALFPAEAIVLRTVLFVVGMLCCALGVSLFFHTYISPEAYELFVKECSARFNIEISRFKTGYDCVSCLVGLILSFCFFGWLEFEGVKLGTIFCALVNGRIIGLISRGLDKRFSFSDGLKLRHLFESAQYDNAK